MEKTLAVHRILGLPPKASPEEMERRCETLLDWLESDGVPGELRAWALGQRALIQEIYDGLASSQEGAAQAKPEGVPPPKGGVARPRVGRTPFLSRLGGKPVTLVFAGVLLGLAGLGILWWKGGLGRGGEEARALPGQETENPAQFLASRQARIQELEGLVAANPADADALFELGETYVVGQQWEDVIQWFTRLLKVEPSNVHARIDIGTASMNLGRYAEALAAFSQALAMEPDNVQAHYNMGFLVAFRRDSPNPDEAVKHWQDVIRLSPDSDLAEVARVHIAQMQPARPSR
ncbi:MAG: tetratricopeptide repeat protein [Chloroflexi bacterium]|nr:tetratricopeptide repeat protein [Chloroflexota bacterium]